MITNPPSNKPVLDSVEAQNAQTRAQLNDALSQILARIILENDENQAILQTLTAVNGNIDSSATAINQNTDAKVNAARDSVNSNVDSEGAATRTAINTARDNVKAEIVRKSAGSLYKGLVDAITNRINTRAAPDDVTGARDSVNSNVDSEGAATRTAINAARDNVKAEVVRTSTGSLYKKLVDAITGGWTVKRALESIDWKIVASMADWNPMTLKNIANIDDPIGSNYANLNSTTWVDLVNESGNGHLLLLNLSRALSVEIYVDNRLAIKYTANSGDNYSVARLVTPQINEGPGIPVIKYRTGLRIRYHRVGAASTSNSIYIKRVKRS